MITCLVIDQIYNSLESTIVVYTKNPPILFTAGQYVELCLDESFDKSTTRKMSIAASPDSELLRFIMHVDSKSLFKTTLLTMQSGDKLYCREAGGNFVLPKVISQPIVCIAGGVGITPFIAMVEYLHVHDRAGLGQISLIHIDNNEFVGENFYKPTGVRYQQASFDGFESQLAELIDTKALCYISGSPRFVVEVRKLLVERGIPKSEIILDAFVGY
jgi:ferredoxin-NADP reductase